jgi:gamma-glutamyltranspeptidase
VADAIVAALQSRGGVMAHGDLAAHATEEAEPISTTYR